MRVFAGEDLELGSGQSVIGWTVSCLKCHTMNSYCPVPQNVALLGNAVN